MIMTGDDDDDDDDDDDVSDDDDNKKDRDHPNLCKREIVEITS